MELERPVQYLNTAKKGNPGLVRVFMPRFWKGVEGAAPIAHLKHAAFCGSQTKLGTALEQAA